MKAVLDVLAAHGDVEWARCVGGYEPLRPPFVVWRYKEPDLRLNAAIAAAVQSYVGATQWIVEQRSRNWVIEPAAFERYVAKFRRDVDAIQRFGVEFPEETNAALSDATHLAEHLERTLSR